jgi:hypothetical protein
VGIFKSKSRADAGSAVVPVARLTSVVRGGGMVVADVESLIPADERSADRARVLAAVSNWSLSYSLAVTSGDSDWARELLTDLHLANNAANDAEAWDEVDLTPPDLRGRSIDRMASTGTIWLRPESNEVLVEWENRIGPTTGDALRLESMAFYEQGLKNMDDPVACAIMFLAMTGLLGLAMEKRELFTDPATTLGLPNALFSTAVDRVAGAM